MRTNITATLILLCALCFSWGEGQTQAPMTAYQVAANSQKNQIVLTVANESSTQAATLVEVRAARIPAALIVPVKVQTIKTLAAAKETDCTFSFDVNRTAKVGAKDTLEFLLRDRAGSAWTKQIVMQYAGPKEYKLEQNFPNPFNPSTTIYYDLPNASRVTIVVYDILGREVVHVVDGVEEAGFHDVRFDAHGLASGAYVYRMQASPVGGGRNFSAVKKMMVVK